MQGYNSFSEENDPYGHHDFGMFELAGDTCYWKLDLYNPTCDGYTEDAADLEKTFRVLTIMTSHDY